MSGGYSGFSVNQLLAGAAGKTLLELSKAQISPWDSGAIKNLVPLFELAQKGEGQDKLSNLLINSYQAPSFAPLYNTVDFNSLSNTGNANINTLLEKARQDRADTYGGVVQSNIDEYAKGLSGQQYSALRSQGLRGIQQNYLSALRDLRAVNSDRSLPSGLAAAQRADLLKQRIRSGKDLQQSLIAQDLQTRPQALALQLQQRASKLGTPELEAQLSNQLNVARLNAQAGIEQTRMNALNQQSQLAHQAEQDRIRNLMTAYGL